MDTTQGQAFSHLEKPIERATNGDDPCQRDQNEHDIVLSLPSSSSSMIPAPSNPNTSPKPSIPFQHSAEGPQRNLLTLVQPYLQAIPVELRTIATTPWDINSEEKHNYNELEWVGDVYVKLAASELLTMQELPMTIMNVTRDHLISGKNLAQLTDQLNLMEGVLPPRPGRQRIISVKEDIFEAFVGAIAKSQSRDAATTFAMLCLETSLAECIAVATVAREESRNRMKGDSAEAKEEWYARTEEKLRSVMATRGAEGRVPLTSAITPATARLYVEYGCEKRGLQHHFKRIAYLRDTEGNRDQVHGIFISNVVAGKGRGTFNVARNLACLDAIETGNLPWMEDLLGASASRRLSSEDPYPDLAVGSSTGGTAREQSSRKRSFAASSDQDERGLDFDTQSSALELESKRRKREHL